MPHGIDIGRRRLLVGAATIAGTVLATDVLSKTERAYAAVKTALNFRERRKRVHPANSPSLDTQVATQSISQGQQGSIQDTPTPDATFEAARRDLVIQQDQKAQTDNRFAWCPVPDIINTTTRRGTGSNGQQTEELYA